MVIKINFPYRQTQFDKIAERLRDRVKVIDNDANSVEFESKPLLSYVIIGRLFTMVDFGKVYRENNRVVYKVVSIRYWVIITGVFLLTGVLPQEYLFGAAITTTIGILCYLIIYFRHKNYAKSLGLATK